MLEAGIKAPEFKLLDSQEKIVNLSNYLGKKVLLWFFPKANTPG